MACRKHCGGGLRRFPAVGKQVFNFAGGVSADADEDVVEILPRVDVVALAGADERIEDRGAAATGIAADKEIVFSTEADGAQCIFAEVVVCALLRRIDSTGENPVRRCSSQPEAPGAAQEVTNGLKHFWKRPLQRRSAVLTGCNASEHRAGPEKASWKPTRHNNGEGRCRRRRGEMCVLRLHRGSGGSMWGSDSMRNKGSPCRCRKATANPRGPALADMDDGWARSTAEAR